MTYLTTPHAGTVGNSILRGLSRGLSRLWAGFIYLGENSSRARAVNALNARSDAELAAMGTSRAEQARRIFSDKYYV